MACTTQSASEYIKSARPHLVRDLKNLSVIVENLYQQGIFTDEEFSEINAERNDFDKTRNILDSVTKKGEAACYEFLKIIDMTRERTLGRPSLLPEKNSAASSETKNFDLHHWISCYSFKEDTQMDTNYLQGSKPCHQYQAKLKSKAKKISNEFWKSNKNLFGENKPDLSYTSLVLKKDKSKKSKMSRPKKMRMYIPEDRSEMSPTKLLALNEDILLVGEPGIGKTALSHQLLKLWAERDSKKLDYMFYFDMRETSHITTDLNLEDLLFSVFSEPDEGKEEVLEDIKTYSDNVTIIFDGVTDLSSSVVQRIVKNDLHYAKVIVTCRPDDEILFPEGFLRVEVKGFSEQSVRTYMAQTLGEEQGNVLRNVELLTLCHVPMYALMVAACFSSQTPEDSPQPNSITEIYINIVRFCLQINSNKTKKNNLNSIISDKSEEILSLAEAAFHATEGKTVNLTEFPCEDSCVLSFLKPLDNKVSPTKTVTTYAFLHYTMQEFFAALWLLKNPDKIKDVFQQCLTEEKKHMKHLIPFMCRLLTDKSPSLMKCLIPDQQLKSTSEWFFKEMINAFSPQLCKKDEAGTEASGLYVDVLFLCQCLYESQSPEACVDLLKKLDYDLDLSEKSLSPYSCCAVAYMVNQSQERKVWLNLEDVVVSQQGMRQLFGCLQNVQCSRMTYRGLRLQEQDQCRETPESESKRLLLDLCLKAALHKGESFHDVVKTLFSLFSVYADLDNILLDFYQCVVSEGFFSVIPKLMPLFQSTPAVWSINLSERKSSILLEVLKLTSEKKQVKLTGCSHEESEVRSFLQCLPHISQLSVSDWFEGSAKFFGNLFCAAAEREHQTGEKILELLSSVCTYQTFPLNYIYGEYEKEYQCGFLLDLFSRLKIYETETGLRVLPSLQSVFQSAPAVWSIKLSERKSSILLEVLKLTSEKKQVKLTGCSHEESEVRSFLQWLPHISQLSGDPEFFQRVCTLICVRSREAEQLASLLRLPGFTLQLTGELGWRTCRSVGRVLRLCGSDVDLVFTPRRISVRGASLLFRHTTQLHSLRLSNGTALFLSQWVRRKRVACLLAVEELSLAPQRGLPSQRVLLKVVSSLASLLRCWTVSRLDLTEFCGSALSLVPLLLHDGPLTIKLSGKISQELLSLLQDVQDEDLTWAFFKKADGDLSSCSLNWEVLHYLLQQSSAQTITVNLRKNRFLQENIPRLLPFLEKIVFKRPCPSFVLTAITQIYCTRASPFIPSLLRSLDNVINLTCREMNSVDCAALLFTLQHSDRVKLNLLWTSIPTEEMESFLFTLDRVSQLSVDRNLLLKLIHCCAASDAQQGAAVSLLRTLQHRLDLSCSSCVELLQEGQSETLSLTDDDCRAVSTILRHSSQDTELHLQDCEVEGSGLDLLFPVLDRVLLRASKTVVLQLMSLVPANRDRDTVKRAESLCGALGGELDLSHTTLDQRSCGALAHLLDVSEGLTELDLSHCELTDQLLLSLLTHLHKVQVLDLSHNKITDASADMLLELVSINPSMDTVRLFGNNIKDRTPFKKLKQFEIW